MSLDSCPAGSALMVMVANVKKSSQNADEFLEIATETDPNVLLVMETDDYWDEQLAPLRDRYARVEQFSFPRTTAPTACTSSPSAA